MLLNRSLTTFLSQNTTTQLPTLLLLSPTGKLLTSSSPLSATTLRQQATLACSLWTLYQPSISSQISASLPHTGHDSDSGITATDNELSTITIQLTAGIMVIRQLSCGLLFVAIGSSPSPSPQTQTQTQTPLQSAPSSPPAGGNITNGEEYTESSSLIGMGSANASESGSVRSVGGTRTGIMVIRRRADEVGRWLDGQLEGFMLSSAEGR